MSANLCIIQGLFSAVLLTDCAEKLLFFLCHFYSHYFHLHSDSPLSKQAPIMQYRAHSPTHRRAVGGFCTGQQRTSKKSLILQLCVCRRETLPSRPNVCERVCLCVAVDDSQPGRERECTLELLELAQHFYFFFLLLPRTPHLPPPATMRVGT